MVAAEGRPGLGERLRVDLPVVVEAVVAVAVLVQAVQPKRLAVVGEVNGHGCLSAQSGHSAPLGDSDPPSDRGIGGDGLIALGVDQGLRAAAAVALAVDLQGAEHRAGHGEAAHAITRGQCRGQTWATASSTSDSRPGSGRTPTMRAPTSAGTTDRPHQARPSASELGAVLLHKQSQPRPYGGAVVVGGVTSTDLFCCTA